MLEGLQDDIAQYLGLLFNCGLPIGLILLGLVAGRAIEQAHFRRLDRREADLQGIPLTNLDRLPPGMPAGGAMLVSGSVVVGSDYLRTTLAGLRKLVGGEVRGFNRLMSRARREAICRLLTEASACGATAVVNLRLEVSNIGAMRRKKIAPMVEVIAYGTAVLPPGTRIGAMDLTLPCPSCGYALIGIDDLGCPECGWSRADRERQE